MIAIFPEICAETDPCEVAKLTRKYFLLRPHSVTPDLDSMMKQCGIGFSIQQLDQGAQAVLAVKDDKGRFDAAIILNQHVAEDEKSFLLAHCLGRYFLKVLPAIARGDFKTSGYRIRTSPIDGYTQQRFLDIDEQQATRFASEILLPEDKVHKAFAKIQDPESLANFFCVPALCMRMRLQELHLLHHGQTPIRPPAKITIRKASPRTTPVQKPGNEKTTPSLDRIRALAQKIDHTVKV